MRHPVSSHKIDVFSEQTNPLSPMKATSSSISGRRRAGGRGLIKHQSSRATSLGARGALVGSLVCLLAACQSQPAGAMFNCLTPNMFKMGGKLGPGQPGERASWYPQTAAAMAYGQHPMR